jgi:hypothetical protein
MERAAPPDDGGDRGSFTVPIDTLVETDDDVRGPSPALHRDHALTPQDPPGRWWSLVVGVALVLLSLLLFGVYVPT